MTDTKQIKYTATLGIPAHCTEGDIQDIQDAIANLIDEHVRNAVCLRDSMTYRPEDL